jgi:hypothetical protein
MAKIVSNEKNIQTVKWGEGILEEIVIDKAILDENVLCKHCLKELKAGKPTIIAAHWSKRAFFIYPSGSVGESHSTKPAFCSANHARIYAKKNKGSL